MIFTDEELKEIDVSTSDEWQFPDSESTEANVMLSVYDNVARKACDFYGIRYEDVTENGWVDIYAYIDVVEKKVTRLIWVINDEPDYYNDLEVKVSSEYEANALFEQLLKTEGMEEFIKESVKYAVVGG